MSVYISNLPEYTGNTYNGYIVWNDSGETTTYKTKYQPQLKPGTGSNSVVHISQLQSSASGINSANIGGSGHTNSGNNGVIIGGADCVNNSVRGGIFASLSSTSGVDSAGVIIGGQSNTTSSGYYQGIVGGTSNNVTGTFGFIGGGNNNVVNAQQGGIIGGQANTSGYGCFVGGGQNNFVNGNGSGIIGGFNSILSNANFAAIVGSQGSKIYAGNDTSFTIVGGSSNVVSANGGVGMFVYGGSSNRIQNFSGPGDALRFNYGGILGGLSNYIGDNRANGDNTTAGQNAYPIIIGGFFNTIKSDAAGVGNDYKNWYSAIINSNNSSISGGTTGGTIINSVDSQISGRTRATMIGTSGRTADADNTTYVENTHAFRTYSTQVQAETSGTTFTCNLNNGGKVQFYLTGASTIDITNVRDGQSFLIKTQTDGGHTITWTSTGYTFKWKGASSNPGNNKIDLFRFEVFGSVIYGELVSDFS